MPKFIFSVILGALNFIFTLLVLSYLFISVLTCTTQLLLPCTTQDLCLQQFIFVM